MKELTDPRSQSTAKMSEKVDTSPDYRLWPGLTPVLFGTAPNQGLA